jgi:hypothetical protein
MPRSIKQLVIHHSAGSRGSVAEFRRLHRARGYSDIGYHAVIQPDGRTEAGRSEAIDGAGVWGNNSQKLHVCLIGQFAVKEPGYTGPPTLAQLAALGRWLDSRGKTYGPSHPRPVVGHREITLPGHGTACPGDLPLDLIRAWFASGRSLSLPEYLNAPAEVVGAAVSKLKGEPAAAGANTIVALRLNGKELPAEDLILQRGRAFVAARALEDAGAAVRYDPQTREVLIELGPPEQGGLG